VKEQATKRGYGRTRSSTATRTDTPLRDIPQAVSIVSRELIGDQAMQNMADVVRYVPGVMMGQGEGHRDQPVIRGNNSTADFFVDGVRDDAQYLRDLYNAERVEALKGSNAMMFGRGGGGGVINRVSREAQWAPTRSVTLEGGSFAHRRATLDVGRALSGTAAARLTGMIEHSDLFRDETRLERFGVNPTAVIALDERTSLRLGYELFEDQRTVDRGIPAYQGRPVEVPITAFFGHPDTNHARARVHSAGATFERRTAGDVLIRNRTRYTYYDKLYRNVVPGDVDPSGTQVKLSAYDNATRRNNLFNQTDVTWSVKTGQAGHLLLAGVELGRQGTGNYRRTGYFDGGPTSVSVPVAQPTVGIPVTFRQNASDADNKVVTDVAGLYVQDQLTLSSRWQAIAGLRYDRFALAYHNNRAETNPTLIPDLRRVDGMLSPRAGLIYKPVERMSVYGSYGVSQLPSAGDQFSSLTATTESLEPERFTNYEIGAKWDVGASLSLTSAAYRLDRTNSAAHDPADPSRTVQTGAQRTTGMELGVSGDVRQGWQVSGGLALQRAVIVNRTTAAGPGAQVPLVPRRTASLWNRVQLSPSVGAGLGLIHQGSSYAAIDNSVILPAFTRADAALYFSVARELRAQLNVENLLGTRYYGTAQGNNNILPGAPRTVRVSVVTGI
jgi:catecholate siderophore receptor